MKLDQYPEIKELASQQHYAAGQTIFYEGNDPSGLYFVVSGTVKLESNDENGKTQTIQIFHANEMVGYRALFAEEKYSASAVAITELKLYYLPKNSVHLLLEKHPKLAIEFLGQITHNMKTMQVRLQHATTHSAQERVAEALLYLRDANPDKSWTRKEIAEWAGTTPETVMRTLSDFAEEGLIELKGRSIHLKERSKLLKKAKISF